MNVNKSVYVIQICFDLHKDLVFSSHLFKIIIDQ